MWNVTTIAGSDMGGVDGQGTNAKFNAPAGLAFDGDRSLFVADSQGHRIRRVQRSWDASASLHLYDVVTLAGTGSPGSTDGLGTYALFEMPYALHLFNKAGTSGAQE